MVHYHREWLILSYEPAAKPMAGAAFHEKCMGERLSRHALAAS
jgi:hypothetical protein